VLHGCRTLLHASTDQSSEGAERPYRPFSRRRGLVSPAKAAQRKSPCFVQCLCRNRRPPAPLLESWERGRDAPAFSKLETQGRGEGSTFHRFSNFEAAGETPALPGISSWLLPGERGRGGTCHELVDSCFVKGPGRFVTSSMFRRAPVHRRGPFSIAGSEARSERDQAGALPGSCFHLRGAGLRE